MNTHTVALVGLGANLGDAVATLRHAFQHLDAMPHTRLLRTSRLYRTPAWGRTDQPDFINAVAMLDTALTARELLDAMLDIEHAAGRDRDTGDRWGPRTLDLDLLLFGNQSIDEPGLHVPHPHLHERSFALAPLVEIAPDAMIPGIGPARAALASIDTSQLKLVG
ncbi:2-amino-4-hydroxy-6-hydroxymethyldihydropteridine diphosphokinase [Agrilutibacter solisilvae]|uniref:2-amino-4-hydroxy-6-hydroxymethyldihydropteridine pyrophosphokinase n=1 Tax=Agrilutibacter solisilvae TaxID=2763317 RepID=A0A975ARK5_9GAMM|nr:2-amino-4-hydroxy-6-hydroxymethyldihydropteridine diphosphokinase [Lysobacter solisilvae]QSX77333.1 2-amino-4-hydroxy-6-hydroxymethyldihydropteridine diphosphokinase [Lysobacter solisilvae]